MHLVESGPVRSFMVSPSGAQWGFMLNVVVCSDGSSYTMPAIKLFPLGVSRESLEIWHTSDRGSLYILIKVC